VGKRLAIGFISLGCPKNQLDLELMLGKAKSEGFEITNRVEEADIIVVNTCAFIGPAVEEAEKNIKYATRYRDNGRCSTLIVSGCLPQYLKNKAAVEYPQVDAFITPDEILNIAEVIKNVREGGKESKSLSADIALPTFIYDGTTERILSTPAGMAYVKVADGCNHKCNFCVIPQIRGKYRSRTVESIAAEIGKLVADGVKEVVLISQDTTQYGGDRKSEQTTLKALYECLIEVNGDFWVRTMYLYPNRVVDSIIELVKNNQDRLLPYFDIPFQHINNDILRTMGRIGGKDAILHCLSIIRREVPDAVIRTNLIVGFPGETDKQFEELLDFVRSGQVDRLGVFTFSNHPGIPIFQESESISEREKLARRDELMRAQQEIALRRNSELVGSTTKILIQERRKVESGDYIYSGRSYRDAYDIDGLVYARSKVRRSTGEFALARIVKAHEYDLEATLEI
jgi:ribosomal protein S12 methylthiotransferase